MAAEGQKKGVAELLAIGNPEFDTKIKEMSLKDLLDTISTLQKEMSKEQDSFNSLSAELNSLKKNSQQYKQISKEMRESQTRLTTLMDRSMKCFQQQGSQSTSTKFPNVQRRNSLKETKPEQPSSKPVQRNQSARIPNGGGEVTRPVLTKVNTKSTPNLVTSANQPVFLKPLTNVNASKIEVKKPTESAENKGSIIKPLQRFQNGEQFMNGNDLKLQAFSESKKPTIKSSATFNLHRSRSNELLANGSSDKNRNSVDMDGITPGGFNVVLRKTNRNLIDNEEQEKNFRHSCDLDLRDTTAPKFSNGVVKTSETWTKANNVSSITVSSSTQPKFVNGNSSVKPTSGAGSYKKSEPKVVEQKQTIVQVQKQEPKVVEQKQTIVQVKKEEPKAQDNNTMKPSEEIQIPNSQIEVPSKPKQNEVSKLKDTKPQQETKLQQHEVSIKPKDIKPQIELQSKQTVKSTAQFRPTTAVEARAVAGGERTNLLQEIQNFKRKPVEEAEKTKTTQADDNKIVKSGIKRGWYLLIKIYLM